MRPSRRASFGAACAAGLLALAIGAPAAGAAPGDPLLPDLLPQPLERGVTIGLYPERDTGRVILDIGFTAANVGAGPLELAPLPEPPAGDPAHDCDADGDPANDRPERQNVRLDADGSGDFDPVVDTGVEQRGDGCSVFHQGHSHWHAATLTTDLVAQAGAPPVRALDKPAYCLIDAGTFDAGLPGFREERVYSPDGCQEGDPQGVSIGWFDRYTVGLAGQQIDVTALAAGTYCVRQTFDPSGSIDEAREDNNTVETPIALDPATRTLAVLAGACAEHWQPVADATPPDTALLKSPARRIRTGGRFATVQFGFVADDGSAQMRCAIDGRSLRPCRSPHQVRLRAQRGEWTRHSFAVVASDEAGNADLSPATWSGRVKRRG